MLIKRILCGITALSVAACAFVTPVFAKAVPNENKTAGMFELKPSDENAEYYDLEETKTADGEHNRNLKFNMTTLNENRVNIVDYSNPNGDEAKFAHTRLLISAQKGKISSSDILNEFRIQHCIGSDEIMRFNIDAADHLSIFGGNDRLRGYALEYTWHVSTTDSPYYNQVDFIQDCTGGVIYLFINGRLNAYSTDGSTDGRFYGYKISKNERDWDEGDILEVGFDDNFIGHTIYKDGNGYTVKIEDVLSEVGISEDALKSYKNDIDKNSEYVLSGGMYTHKQTEPIMVTGTGRCIQFEEGSYSADYGLSVDRNAADTKVLKCKSSTTVNPSTADPGQIELTFRVEEKATYTVWMRYYAPDKRSDSLFWSFNGSAYKNQDLDEESYKWMKIFSGKCYPGQDYKFRIRYREPNNALDCLLVSRVPGFTATGRYGDLPSKLTESVDPLDENRYDNPPIYPPANTHPRVLFRAEDIPRIKANMESPMNAYAMEKFYEDINDPEPINIESSSLSISRMMQIECLALDYAVNGNKESGMKAKNAICAMLSNLDFDQSSIESGTRNAGYTIHVAAKVYDWCYDLFNAAEREKLILDCVIIAGNMEMNWPPYGQDSFAGHGAEAQLLRDYMTFAIATYDERPDFWDVVGGRYYQNYIPVRQVFNTNMFAGSDYGVYRQIWINYSFALIKGMGYEVPIDLEKFYDDSLWSVYYRRPDGQVIRSGDTSHGDKTPMWEYWQTYVQCWLEDSYLSGNPFSKLEFARSTYKMNDFTDNKQNYTSLTDCIIMNNADVEPAKTLDDLPYSKYFGTPNGVMIARTGWEDGVDSPTVVAEMKVQEWQINGHMHLDAGHFQLYYKGMLASDSGVYQGAQNNNNNPGGSAFGSAHHQQYETKTVAHNCMLVYDPSEGNSGSGRGTILDGGQRAINNGNDTGHTVLENEDNHVAQVVGEEIDPTNPSKPAYSYLKGDLTNAYSKKVTDYKRSFMFLNLDNNEVPAAMIVFDKIDSSNPGFKKTWLLHGLEEPEIDGTRTVFRRTYASPIKPYAYNGKLTVDTLLPAKSKIEKVGGEMGYYTVNGKDYQADPFKTQTDEGQTWRMEVSPQNGATGDYFLNVLQVSDNDKENYLPVEMVENNLFYGVKISDRVVTFSKSAKREGGGFTLDASGSGEYQYTLCDIEEGKYTVTVGSVTQVVEATKEGGVLAFKAPAGKVSVTKTPDATVTPKEIKEKEPSTKDPNSVLLKIDNVFVYQTSPAVLKYDTIMINTDDLKKQFSLRKEDGADTVTLSGGKNSITYTNGSNISTVNGEEKQMSAPAVIENGVWLVPVRSAIEALGGSVDWDRWSRTLYVTSPPQDLSLPSGYARIVKGIHDGGEIDKSNTVDKMFDEDASTIWSTNGENRYATFELEKACTVCGVDIMFNPNQGRDAKFTIAVSEDGKKFTDVMKSHGDGSVEGGAWEAFTFAPQSNIKYVRYYGNGSNISRWNAVKEIRIKIQ